MFKRVDRRRRRKEIEEIFGLDGDETGVFGLHDTDSSESESESASSSATSSDGHHIQPTKKRKRGAFPPSNDNESDENEDVEPAVDDERESWNGEDGSARRLTIASALKEPVRLICTDPEAWVCTLCPGKFLKHVAMAKVHEASRVRTI